MTSSRHKLLLVGIASFALAAWGGHELFLSAFEPILKALG